MEVISYQTDNQSPTNLGLFNYAVSYYKSASALKKLNINDITHQNAPVEFLYVHSAELFFKSYLRLEKRVSYIKKISHDFEKLAKSCAALSLSDEEDKTIELIAIHKINSTARYIETGVKENYPTIESLEKLCQGLYDKVRIKFLENGINVR